MKPTQQVVVQLVQGTDEVQVAGVFLDIHLFTHGRFRYAFRVGPTDDAGRLVLTYSDLDQYRLREGQTFLMDYNTKLEDCDDAILIHVPSQDELLEGCAQAKKFYRNLNAHSPRWLGGANHRVSADDLTVHLGPGETQVLLSCKVVA